ncbi:EAL domain-containing protein [Rhodopseudomonas sp. P2A-2r]|uniref:EAL domain-containing protein n=1 Tax=Rhodopseudomonas sp. P2A-2r TaxID=2991972 RepID=UPI002234D587|nr:EAL domain-containing protein [Rhodopseudomonas sp. P2A-2r]UZE52340.1 EAL domain-containing protein [Rhodopseudomonas sp. P2A-2r]
MKAAAIEAAYRSNIETVDQIKLTRGYYTRNVVAKELASGHLTPSHDHKGNPNAIPLPATFVQDISDLLKERDTTLSLISPYPWPNRAGRTMDSFQTTAWDAFQRDPSAIVSREETRDGKRLLRIAVPDRMTEAACVSCHNNSPESPKRDWKLDDVRAVMEVTKVIEPYLAAAEQRSRMIVLAITAATTVVILILFGVAALFARHEREKRDTDQHVHYLAHHDSMTGTLNRGSFLASLTGAMSRLQSRSRVAVHYIDLDRFKEINDQLGHGVGDELLRAVAKRLKRLLGPEDIISRLGGDEFAVAQTNLQDPGEVGVMADRITRALAKPFQLSHHSVIVSGSVGSAGATVSHATGDELLEDADIALYRAKHAGRACYVVFAPEMRDAMLTRRQLEAHIRDAVAREKFEVYFQPLVRRSGRLDGFEALLRLRDDRGEFISPSVFVPMVEDMGAIDSLGAWVIRNACAAAATWPAHLKISVNLSPVQFRSPNSIAAIVADAIAASGLGAGRLELEITEGLLLEAIDDVIEQLFELKNAGAAIVMDDFGTGYSSLGYLWRLPFDKIKVDKSFVPEEEASQQSVTPVLQTIIGLGRTLNMEVTVEGIETEAQAEFFRDLNCDYLQGYLFGRPMPRGDAAIVILRDLLDEMAESIGSGAVATADETTCLDQVAG